MRIEYKKKYLTAFKLFLSGKDINKIAKQCGVTTITIYRWIERNHWREHEQKQLRELEENVYTTVIEEKKRSLQLIKAAESFWAKRLQDGQFKANFGDLAPLQRIKWEILNPRASNINFIKNDNKEISFKIINPDGDYMEAKPEAIDSLEDSTGQ